MTATARALALTQAAARAASDKKAERIIALDVLGCGEGEEVMVVTGSTASAWLGGGKIPIDALIIGSLDQPSAQAKKK